MTRHNSSGIFYYQDGEKKLWAAYPNRILAEAAKYHVEQEKTERKYFIEDCEVVTK